MGPRLHRGHFVKASQRLDRSEHLGGGQADGCGDEVVGAVGASCELDRV